MVDEADLLTAAEAAGPEEDYGDELEDYDGGDDMPPWDEDDHEEMEDE